MKVFISWSGEESHEVALALRDWLPSVIQALEPYVSSEDIDKGARWIPDIGKELEESSFGILCVTPDNLQAPWLNFEAGALSKAVDRSRVSPFLLGLSPSEVTGPLVQFQATVCEAHDVRKLIMSLNSACETTALEPNRLDVIYEVWWPRLEKSMQDIQARFAGQGETVSSPVRRTEADMLQEVLELVREQQKLLAISEVQTLVHDLKLAVNHFQGGSAATRIDLDLISELGRTSDRLEIVLRNHGGSQDDVGTIERFAYLLNVLRAQLGAPNRMERTLGGNATSGTAPRG